MNANHSPLHVPAHASYRRGICGHILAAALGFALIGTAPLAFAETHAVIPGVIVNTNTMSVAVDPVTHYVFTVNFSNQVQVSFVSGGAWATAPLGIGQQVKQNTLLYVDSTYHYLYYVGSDSRIYCWLFNGTVWQNLQLNSSAVATDLIAVDSSMHIIWFTDGKKMNTLSFDGTAWVTSDPEVCDYNKPTCGIGGAGGAVDNTSHTLYWVDTAGTVRRLIWSGLDFLAPKKLNCYADGQSRPAVNPGTRDVYFLNNVGQVQRYVPDFQLTLQQVGDGIEQARAGTPVAVNPLNGKVFYNRIAIAQPEIAFITPAAGPPDTWPLTSVGGTSGQVIKYSAMDNGNGWYFYTITTDAALHIIF